MRIRLPLAMGLLLTAACPAGFPGLCDNGACDGDASVTDGGTDSGPQCDPKTENCINPASGVFVSPTGNDGNDGSQASPLQTIGAGLTKAKAAAKSNVYICAGTYPENVVIKDAISLLGGFSCTDWKYGGVNTVTVAPASGYPLHVMSTTTSISDLSFVAADAATKGESSVAGFVDTSTVAFLRTTLTAGKGRDADDGTTGSNYTAVAQNDPSIAGKPASGALGGGFHACALCADTKNSTGGFGGNGGTSPGAGQDGAPSLDAGAPNDGKGGNPDIDGGGVCMFGHKGTGGVVGPSAVSPTSMGVLDAAGWQPTTGGAGGNGGPGQGGGGGGGAYDMNNLSGGAGGGGCGGCGGASGTGGGGGGASIAVAAYKSALSFTASELHAAAPGNGGAGAAAQGGQPGGFSGQNVNPGCPGGTGGTGGTGGAGAGGTGGISVGILWKGTQPTVDSATSAAIAVAPAGGKKGTGGQAGSNDGIDGVAQPILQAP